MTTLAPLDPELMNVADADPVRRELVGRMKAATLSLDEVKNGVVHFNEKHGHRKNNTPTYLTWKSMIQRCTNSKFTYFKDYGGRGIIVCERWRVFSNFLEDMGIRPKGKTLDRKNNDANYEPNNCRWTTPTQQQRNRRGVKLSMDIALQVRSMAHGGIGRREIAKTLGVNFHSVCRIIEGKQWREAA